MDIASERSSVADPEGIDETAARYLRFAAQEARGRSNVYEELAEGIARDEEILRLLSALPREKRQPNLLLAAARLVCGEPGGWTEFRDTLSRNSDAVFATMLVRSTQTNEPARCATLLPLLGMIDGPIALLEVGASAGLCLLPDWYGYDFGRLRIDPDGVAPDAPVFPCKAGTSVPLPRKMPKIVWRAGLDLNPLDVSDKDDAAWLEALVWPGQPDRLSRLRAAIEIATSAKPRVVQGDLRLDLNSLMADAPGDATRVIFHTAVLAYVSSRAERDAFAERATVVSDIWIANESPSVFPTIAAQASAPGRTGNFLLSMNGTPVAWTDPHGASIDWIDGGDVGCAGR